jgi:hypothetical protein
VLIFSKHLPPRHLVGANLVFARVLVVHRFLRISPELGEHKVRPYAEKRNEVAPVDGTVPLPSTGELRVPF